MKKLSEIGYIQKAHGLKGEVFIKSHDEDLSYLSKGLVLYLAESPYTVSNFRKVTGGTILKFEQVDDRNQSDLLKGKVVSVEAELFAELSNDEELYLNQLFGFSVIMSGVKQGEVTGFAKTDAHDLLRISTDKGEIELPFVDQFISKIDDLEKELHVNCPAELFDPNFFSGGSKK